jgi:exopolysaccharide biosynthesis polyprenyl glycosylphosphotransferase
MDTIETIASENSTVKASSLLLPVRRERQLSVSLPLKKAILVATDLLLLNLALFLALTFRQFEMPGIVKLSEHLLVFNLLHVSWLLMFYSVGLYDIQVFAVSKAIERNLIQGIGISGIVTAILFYSLSFVKIQPKTVLIMDLLFAGVFLLVARRLLLRYNRNGSSARILLCGSKTEMDQLEGFACYNGHLGYEISKPLLLWDGNNGSPAAMIVNRMRQEHVDIVAITRALTEDSKTRGLSYQLLCAGVPVVEFSHLAEELTGKIPVSVINETWFVENLREFDRLGFDTFKRWLDIAAAIILGILAVVLFPVVALAIKLDSSGPVLFRQKRTGKGGREFDLIKFRTMRQNAETEGAQWAAEKDDRITRVGGLLRKTRIDELPQLWNVMKGDMSLVGPRPERPEFVETLSQAIPFYEARHVVNPGLTGWAQVNFRYGASVEDAMEKLQYDLYYIKNRSAALELSILLRTGGTVLRYEGR